MTREEPAKTNANDVEKFFAFDLDQILAMLLAGGVPAPGRQLDINRYVLTTDKFESSFFDQACSYFKRNKKEEANVAACCQFFIRDRACDDDRIGE